jgi:hypothetical protein
MKLKMTIVPLFTLVFITSIWRAEKYNPISINTKLGFVLAKKTKIKTYRNLYRSNIIISARQILVMKTKAVIMTNDSLAVKWDDLMSYRKTKTPERDDFVFYKVEGTQDYQARQQ